MKFPKVIGITGILCILIGYYMLWVPLDAGLSEVVIRTRFAIIINLCGSALVLFYLYKR